MRFSREASDDLRGYRGLVCFSRFIPATAAEAEVNYNLEATYAGIYDEVVSGIDSLNLAPYNLGAYKKAGVEIDGFEAGRLAN